LKDANSALPCCSNRIICRVPSAFPCLRINACQSWS
jgi:hypothetical protein